MKRRMLALALAMSMAMGMSTVAFAAGHEGDHGTKDKAVVSDDVDEMTAGDVNTDDDKTTGQTQFYINIDKDATDGPIIIPDPEDITGADGICHYDVEWEISRSTNVSVTVPLYVCMYGYGGNGKVVAPEDDAYQMTNESTYTDKREAKHVYACYQVVKILNSVEYTEEDNKTYEGSYIAAVEELIKDTLTTEQKSGQYGYYKDSADVYHVVALSSCDIHDVNSTCGHKDDADYTYFYRDTENEATVPADATTGREKIEKGTVQYANNGTANEAYLPINVPTIKAEVNTWEIRSTGETKDLKAGQIAMTINDLDLSKVEGTDDHTLDIKDLNWKIKETGKKEGTLNLPVRAAIAGGSVNEEGCVPVVRVTYTVAPALDSVNDGDYAAAVTTD